MQFRSSDHRTEMKVSCSGLTATVQVEEHSAAVAEAAAATTVAAGGGGSGSGRSGGHG